MSVQFSETESFGITQISTISGERDCPATFIVDDVRIIPPYMVFENAYEGKKFLQKMIIQNCGAHMAFIRMSNSSSTMFQFKSFPHGIYLAPGMRIIRNISYTYTSTLAILQAFSTVSVNDKEETYNFYVTISMAVLSVEPQLLDFGRVDAVNHAITRTFYIKNSGYKGTQFSIDLGRNPLDILVEPLKGMAPAMTSIPINVEVMGSEEGEFAEEIWIKAVPPLRVVITGTFISPRLLVRKFISSLDFTLIEFPPTYYGSKSTQTLLIKNFSSFHSMFCVMAEFKGTTMTLDDAVKSDDNFKNFIVHPIDGRLASQRGAIIQITFQPAKTARKDKNYAVCFLKLVRMDCRDITQEDQVNMCVNEAAHPSMVDLVSFILSVKDAPPENIVGTLGNVLLKDDTGHDENFSFVHSVGVCLHGEKECPGIFLRPNLITLNELTLGQMYKRELLVTNRSSRLAVRVRYSKTPLIDVIPNQFDLKAKQSVEVLLTIRTFKLDRVEKRVTFDLLSEDYPSDKKIFRKVGVAYFKICFDTSVVARKSRTEQCVLCEDLTRVKLEAEFPFRLSASALAKKNQNDEYYLKYIRSLQKQPPEENEELQEYQLTKFPHLKCGDFVSAMRKKRRFNEFAPLAPRLLHNIKITPKSIKIQKVAAYTTITDYLQIENLNTFPIYVFLKASKSCIVFDSKSRYIIRSKENRKISFTFSTFRIGRHNINILVLINNSALFEVTAVAQVVPKTLKVETNHVKFTEADGDYKFFKLINALNAYTAFEWDIPEGSCFDVFPRDGGIRAESYILCMVTYRPDPTESNTCECILTSESGQKRIITISYQKRLQSVVFDCYDIDLGVIALNVPIKKKLTLKNLKNFQTLYSVQSEAHIPGITIEPKEGILDRMDSQVFTINVLLNAVIQFSTEIVFAIGNEEVSISLKGAVNYPKVTFKPPLLSFRKISIYSFDTLAFKATNLSQWETNVTFPFEDYPEFSITDSEDAHSPHLRKLVLVPNQSKVLFLHFRPNHVTTYSFYLPYIINDLIGPPVINSGRSNFPQYFLEDATNIYKDITSVVFEKIPRMLPLVRINCSALDNILEFSSLNINFLYFGEEHYSNVTSIDFEITNTGTEIAEVCIRIDDLQSPFSLTPKDDSKIEFYSLSYKITLEPNETIVFETEFSPSEFGTYTVRLPIFLRHYYDDKIFNYLMMRGVYDTPKITAFIKRCNLEPVPLRISNETNLTLRMENHFEKCTITVESDVAGIYPSFKTEKDPKKEDYVINATISYQSKVANCYCTELIFQCTCYAVCSITLTGVTENCLLTTHAFSYFLKRETKQKCRSLVISESWTETVKYVNTMINQNTTCFPLFPNDDDSSKYAKYMRRIKKTLENWLFSQGFYLKNYYRIPEGFSDFCKVVDPAQKKVFGGMRKPKFSDLPLLQLILNIAGPNLRDILAPSYPKQMEEMDWLTYTQKVNSNILYYLRGFLVFLPHVKSKYLLNYEQYEQYEKIKHPENRPMDEPTFYRLSKQCWIDLILQIIKALFLFRTVGSHMFSQEDSPRTSHVSQSKLRYQQSTSMSAISRTSEDEGESVLDMGIYGKHEKELITWLLRCYDEEKLTLWTSPGGDKDIVFLDEHLKDGLILGAVTAHYCPYVRSEIRNMYTKPNNPEELLHNACLLVKTWKTLRLSYVISPLSIQSTTMVEMLLLVDYLYDVLPNCYPREEIAIEAPLTQTSSASVVLENLGTESIHYRVVLFNNESKLFNVANDTIVIEPKRSRTIKIQYHAKCVTTVTATVLFSGETPGYKFAKSVAVNLKGVADISYVSMMIPIAVDLYRMCEVTMDIQSPFKVKAHYSLFYGNTPSKDKKHLFPWSQVKNLKIRKEFFFTDDICDFDENGQCSTKQLLCLHELGPRNIWLAFTNPEIGDWGVQINLTGKVSDACFEPIEVHLPENYENNSCRCTGKPSVAKNCPMIIQIKVPMKNNLLWNSYKKMLLNYVSADEYQFWFQRIFTPVGTRILKLIRNSETHPLKQPIEETVEYKIEVEKCPFVTLRQVIFEDVTSEDVFTLPVHPLKDLLRAEKCVLKLTSADGREKRFYRLFFHKWGEKVEGVEKDQ